MADDSQRARHHRSDAQDPETPEYGKPHGGWGSAKGILTSARAERPSLASLRALKRLNQPKGVMCPSCAWSKPGNPSKLEICENGAKAVFSELTRDRADVAFFERHSVSELRTWSDHDLDHAGRLTHPMRYDAERDRYVPVPWEDAFAAIGARLRALDPQSVITYASGHAGLEASFAYQLFARMHGHNNLPQSSNMCHETTSIALKQRIGTSVGTCILSDFEHCDAIFVFGQNPGTNSPRFLKPLQDAARRGCPIVVFNPIREKGLIAFADPQSVRQMTLAPPTSIASLYLQVRPGGDIAAMAGILKHLISAEDAAPGSVFDHAFLREHTEGFDAVVEAMRAYAWDEIEAHSGLDRELLARAAEVWRGAERVIGVYGMGLTQHVHGADNLAMLVNLLLVGGHIGRTGAGISPVRGHSNVQGQRTVGIFEKPEAVPLDRLEARYGFAAPRTPGRHIVEVGRDIIEGSVRAVLCLGGNLLRAMPDLGPLEAGWAELDTTVSISTKLNRTHLIPGEHAWILPCLGRLERDQQGGVQQAVTVEDTFSHIHASYGTARPASAELRSELAIVAGLASATLTPNPRTPWARWTADSSLLRDEIEAIWPDDFRDFNRRMTQPGGFYRGNPARERRWQTASGKAHLAVPTSLSALGVLAEDDVLTLITLRSNDQFNTTVYGFSDRLRGLSGSREILLINHDELARLGLSEGQVVTAVSAVEDGVQRRVTGLKLVAFDLPPRCVGGYFPELNPLVPMQLHDRTSKTPAYKGAPIRLER